MISLIDTFGLSLLGTNYYQVIRFVIDYFLGIQTYRWTEGDGTERPAYCNSSMECNAAKSIIFSTPCRLVECKLSKCFSS